MRLWPHLGFASRVGGLCCRGRTESGKKNELPVPLPALTSLWLVPISSCLVILADSDLFPAIGQESNVPLGLGAVPCQGGRKGTKGSWESPQPTVVEEKQSTQAQTGFWKREQVQESETFPNQERFYQSCSCFLSRWSRPACGFGFVSLIIKNWNSDLC